jgi:predicted dehydrogenase
MEGTDIRVGVIGLGKMGIAHMAILNALGGVHVRAVAENKKIIVNGIRSVLPKVAVYDRFEEMLDRENLDAVYIASPTSLHVKTAEECLARGLDFFVEKPLGVTGRETGHLPAIARDRNVISMVGYCKHFVETFERAKEVLGSGVLGKPVYFTSFMYVSQLFRGGAGWRYKKEASGGGVMNILATHLVDVLLWLFGPVTSVTCSIKSQYSVEVEDFAHSYLTFSSGLEGPLDSSWSVRNYRLPEIKVEVQCENGMLAVTEDYIKYVSDSENTFHVQHKQDLFRGVEICVGGAEYAREDMYFIDCVRKREGSSLDLAYGHEVQRVTDGMYESARSRRTVELPPWESFR